MELNVEWGGPILLRTGTCDDNCIYTVDLKKLPAAPGIYILARRWGGGSYGALYIGVSRNLRNRIRSQLLGNVRLMEHLRTAKGGKRVVIAGRFIAKPGQRVEKCLRMIERALIRHFLSEAHDLVNKSGTKLRRHEVKSSGKQPKRLVPTTMFIEKAKTR